MTATTFPEWEQELDAWEAKYRPIKNRFNGFIKKQLTNKKIFYSTDTLCTQLKHSKEKKLAANNAK